MFNQNYFTDNDSISNVSRLLLTPCYKDVSITGQFYTNSIENDDFFSPANLTLLKDFYNYPNSDLFSTVDDLTLTYKTTQALLKTSFTNPATLNTFFNTPSSYLSVFNNFRADFEDFSFNFTDSTAQHFANFSVNDASMLKNLQLSNLLMLRNNVKNSIVTYNALKKVFRARFDESRSHTSLHLFAQSALPQPFINDGFVNYSQLLTKDSSPFYRNVFYKNANHKI
jgi:hypothetical protein